MKIRDYILWGNGSGTLAANAEEYITWNVNSNTYYEIDANEGMELVELGMNAPNHLYKTMVRNKDNTDWLQYGFYTMNDARLNELPYDNRRDWSRVKAAVAPNVTVKQSPSLKMSTGDRFKVAAVADATGFSDTERCVALLRKYVAQNTAEQDAVEHLGMQFGGIDSNAQVYHYNGTISSTTTNTWCNIFEQTILKNELFAYNKLGIHPVTNSLKSRIYIDGTIEYNTYPTTTTYNMCPIVPEVVNVTYDPTLTAETTTYSNVKREYVFDKPLVITKTINKTVDVQLMDSGSAVASAVYARLAGIKYKV